MNTIEISWHHYGVKEKPTATIENMAALLKALNFQFIPHQDLAPEKFSITLDETIYTVGSFELSKKLKSSKNFLSRIESEIAKSGLPARTINHLDNAIQDLRSKRYPKPKPTPPQKSTKERARSKNYAHSYLKQIKQVLISEVAK